MLVRGKAGELHGMVISHVDDLLMGGDAVAKASIQDLGAELGLGAFHEGEFTYGGKNA